MAQQEIINHHWYNTAIMVAQRMHPDWSEEQVRKDVEENFSAYKDIIYSINFRDELYEDAAKIRTGPRRVDLGAERRALAGQRRADEEARIKREEEEINDLDYHLRNLSNSSSMSNGRFLTKKEKQQEEQRYISIYDALASLHPDWDRKTLVRTASDAFYDDEKYAEVMSQLAASKGETSVTPTTVAEQSAPTTATPTQQAEMPEVVSVTPTEAAVQTATAQPATTPTQQAQEVNTETAVRSPRRPIMKSLEGVEIAPVKRPVAQASTRTTTTTTPTTNATQEVAPTATTTTTVSPSAATAEQTAATSTPTNTTATATTDSTTTAAPSVEVASTPSVAASGSNDSASEDISAEDTSSATTSGGSTSRYVQENEAKAQAMKSNIVGQTSFTENSQTTPQTSVKVTTDTPTKTSSASVYTEYSEPTKQGAAERYDATMRQQGYTKNAKGQWVPNTSSLSSVLDMKRHNEEVERVNKAKALNAGLFDAITLLGDMFSANAGGNVYKRDRSTIAENAAKDTIARRDALKQAEIAAREKDKENLMKALSSAQSAYDKYLELNGIKKTSQTQEGYQESRTTENSGGTTTSTSATSKSADAVKTIPMVVMNADGTSSTLYVNKAKAEAYRTSAWNSLMQMNLSQNAQLARYAEEAGYLSSNGTWKPSLSNVILNDPVVIAALPASTQQMNRELRYDSEEYAALIYGDEYQRMSEAEKERRLKDVESLVYGNSSRTFGNVEEYDD